MVVAIAVLTPMTMTLRIVVHDGPVASEQRHLKFPVRIGRDPASECRVLDAEVSRSHATLDVRGGELVLRDESSRNGTVYVGGGGSTTCLRGGEAVFSDGRVEFWIGRVRGVAVLEEVAGLAPSLPPGLAPVARDAARAILDSCETAFPPPPDAATVLPRLRRVMNASFASLLAVRVVLHEADRPEGDDPSVPFVRDEGTSALLKWTQATALALRVLEHGVEALEEQNGRLAREAADAVEALLRELAPERLERETSDVCTEWPAARAEAFWARYRTKHQKLMERHARGPGLLLGKAIEEEIEASKVRIARCGDTLPSNRAPEDMAPPKAAGGTLLEPSSEQPPSSQ